MQDEEIEECKNLFNVEPSNDNCCTVWIDGVSETVTFELRNNTIDTVLEDKSVLGWLDNYFSTKLQVGYEKAKIYHKLKQYMRENIDSMLPDMRENGVDLCQYCLDEEKKKKYFQAFGEKYMKILYNGKCDGCGEKRALTCIPIAEFLSSSNGEYIKKWENGYIRKSFELMNLLEK